MAQDKDTQLECLVAAILTVAVTGTEGISAEWAVKRYAQTLERLRAMGGPVNPSAALSG